MYRRIDEVLRISAGVLLALSIIGALVGGIVVGDKTEMPGLGFAIFFGVAVGGYLQSIVLLGLAQIVENTGDTANEVAMARMALPEDNAKQPESAASRAVVKTPVPAENNSTENNSAKSTSAENNTLPKSDSPDNSSLLLSEGCDYCGANNVEIKNVLLKTGKTTKYRALCVNCIIANSKWVIRVDN